jgi:hypothetical protein
MVRAGALWCGFPTNLLALPAIVKAGLANLAFTRLNFGGRRIVPPEGRMSGPRALPVRIGAAHAGGGREFRMSNQIVPTGAEVPPDRMVDDDLRARALKHLKAKRDLQAHLIAYVTVNLMLIGIWWASGVGFFWPIFILLGWGIGLAFNVWDVMSPEPGPAEVEAEMDRLRTRHG